MISTNLVSAKFQDDFGLAFGDSGDQNVAQRGMIETREKPFYDSGPLYARWTNGACFHVVPAFERRYSSSFRNTRTGFPRCSS